ncbi:MAG: sugar ABC transporter permease [Anaerolineae bacterium]
MLLRSTRPILPRMLPYLLIAPTLFFIFLFTIYPAIQSITASLYRPGRGTAPAEFVGFQNYADLFNPSHFLGSRFGTILGNTLIFTLATVALSVPIALGFALLLNRKICLRGLWRFSLFYPALLPFIGAASLWAFLFADPLGLINVILRALGNTSPPNWTGDPNVVLWVVILVNVWKQGSFYTVFYLAGLQNIPKDVYEAADIEGASAWQVLRFITLPLLRRTTLFISIVSFSIGFQTVEHLPALGSGGPGDSSNLLLYFIFQTIPERRNWGYVNAMTVLMLGILLIFTVSNLFFFERGRDDEKAY